MPPEVKRGGAAAPLAAATAMLFVMGVGYGALIPALPTLAARLGGGAGLVFAIYAAFSGAKIAAQLPGGVIADRVGDLRALALALALFSIAIAASAAAPTAGLLPVARALEGVATGLAYPAALAATTRLAAPARLGRALGVVIGLGTGGMVAGALLGALVGVERVGPTLWCASALAVATLVGCGPIAWRHSGAPGAPRRLGAELRTVAAFAGSRPFLQLLAPLVFGKLVFQVMQPLLPLHGATVGLSAAAVGALFGASGLLFGATQPVAGALADVLAPRPATLLAMGATALALAGLGACGSAGALAATFLCYSVASSLVFALDLRQVAALFGEEQARGRVFGVAGSISDVAMVVAPLAFEPCYRRAPHAAFLGLAALALPLGWAYLRHPGRRAAYPPDPDAAG